MGNKMTKCNTCGADIAASARVCPACGAKNGKPIYKLWWFWAIAVIFLFLIIPGKSSKTDVQNTSTAPAASASNTEVNSVAPDTANQIAESKEETQPKNDGIPTEYKNALKKAKIYSDTMHMSKRGIYDQLVSEYGEKFPEDAAQYAVDNLDADWNANALAKAKDYQKLMAMSSSAIYDQLTSDYGEKFTAEEAQYAIDNLE